MHVIYSWGKRFFISMLRMKGLGEEELDKKKASRGRIKTLE